MVLKARAIIPVRFVECDPMGVVHHSHYFVWYEIGRVTLAKQIGLNLEALPDGSTLHFPVVTCSSHFRVSARYGDIVEVETVLKKPVKARFDFTYRVYRQQGHQLLTEGASSHVLMRTDGRILFHLPPHISDQIERYLAETEHTSQAKKA
ncbi:acyl-CoA thioester hydrolase [Thermosporothrix hazakensis]|jgi:acyl-CoA thioester hydrolase|uniref:Acyl-CoA thioester hydrolase n=2 Tax=Thermosporothrix TaxID=768650 RepID=A0A326TZA1_THEHA|nr:thioesterase family protein [Thermosporothrix hazakensis]PZW22835.1 acyl-CoA thioester hydrolase [Thermosporothrix hazakensis]